jgi:hypothetical protein
MNGSKPRNGNGAIANSNPDWDVETLIEQIWNDLEGTVTRSTIRQVLGQVIPRYENARIRTYVPIFLCKETVEQLHAALASYL